MLASYVLCSKSQSNVKKKIKSKSSIYIIYISDAKLILCWQLFKEIKVVQLWCSEKKSSFRNIQFVIANTDKFGNVLDNFFFLFPWPYILLLFEVRSCSYILILHVGFSLNELWEVINLFSGKCICSTFFLCSIFYPHITKLAGVSGCSDNVLKGYSV